MATSRVIKDNNKEDNNIFKIWRPWLQILKALLVLALALIFYALKFVNYYPEPINLQHPANFFGVTFSTEYATSLGLDWQETYQAILNDLQAKYIRVPIYWDEIEKTEGVYDFSKYDYILQAGEKHQVKFILSIGRRTPRWPECHNPAWLNNQSDAAVRAATLKTIATIVERYRTYDSVEYWQVENEPYLSTFGVCPPLDQNLLQQEFSLVRSLSNKPTIITASGEMSLWQKEAKIGDIVGITVYRVVYNSWFGYLHYPFSVWFYQEKAHLAGLSAQRLMVLELQAEPWVPQGGITNLSATEINKSLSVNQFRANLQYAINLNFSRTYLWGVEWWYWQKKYGNPAYWNIAVNLFK
jgi:hypothetical protein